jgi:hypothetical protein
MKRVILTLCSLPVIFSGFTSCDDGDTTKPAIELLSPAEGAILKTGSNIHLEMNLEDNEMLSSYKIDIHDAAGHGHDTQAETVAFTYSKSWSISGSKNTHIHHHEIPIPEDAKHGAYHFMVYCTDASGNESYAVHNITLSNEGDDGHHE